MSSYRTERLQSSRTNESEETRNRRRATDAARHQLSRANESQEARNRRRAVNAARNRLSRANESQEARNRRRAVNATRNRLSRANESQEARNRRRAVNAARNRLSRANESQEARNRRRAVNATRNRLSRANESQEARNRRRAVNATRNRLSRANESQEARNRRRAVNAARNRSSRTNESQEVRNRRQTTDTARHRSSRANESQEVRNRRRERNTQRMQLSRANEPSERHLHRGVAGFQVRPQLHYLGKMDQECKACGALHFAVEKFENVQLGSNRIRVYNSCCNKGNICLKLFADFPQQLRNLLTRNHPQSENFLANIRNYNNSLAMASMVAQIDTPHDGGPYCFCIHGMVYHQIGSLRPLPDRDPLCAQVLILDTEQAAAELAGRNINRACEEELFRLLHSVLEKENPFVRSFKLMDEVCKSESEKAQLENRQQRPVRMVFENRPTDDRRRYNIPTANEVAVIYVGDEEEIPGERQFVINERSGNLEFISDIDPRCDPLTYPLLFPRGEFGWHPNLEKIDLSRRRTRISQREYYAFLFFPRRDFFNPILYSSKLFQQYAVDSWVKTEQNRLNYIRKNQRELRLDTIQGLADYMIGDPQNGPPGRQIILPVSYQGGPRSMVAAYQDAMAIVSKYGKPDYFITFTCSPNWQEINESLYSNQTASDRPDLVARVFELKLKALENELLEKDRLGKVAAYIWVVEFQKRGLPHCHMLLFMTPEWKPRTAEDVDKVIMAELPNHDQDAELYEIVSTTMIHRPCGALNPQSPCMRNGVCSKKFPKPFRNDTAMDGDSYPLYRRRNDGRTVTFRNFQLDNRSVVPYSPYLLRLFAAHINVEVCALITAVKYLFKYIYKGTDRARIQIGENEGKRDAPIDEIRAHLDARYVCAPEAAHRIFAFEMQKRSDSVMRLQVHLSGFESIVFRPGQERQALEAAQSRNSTLTAWFAINRSCAEIERIQGQFPENMKDSRQFRYYEMPEHYTFENGQWKPRKRPTRTIGRMYYVGPHEQERFALRLLLLHTKGATSYDDIKTIEHHQYATFMETARETGLMINDTYYLESMKDAAQFHMPYQLRGFFSCLLGYCDNISDPQKLWDEFKKEMSADFAQRGLPPHTAESLAYFDIAERLSNLGRNIKEFLKMSYERIDLPTNHFIDYDQHRRIGEEKYQLLNIEQKQIVDVIIESVLSQNGKCFFIDGPGGSGKTFIYNTIYHRLRAEQKNVQCVAWTGIAANLLPDGRTVNSTFKLIIANNNKTSSMKRQSIEAKKLETTDVIIWDEASMAPRQALEAIDNLLRDIMQKPNDPFGGKTIVLGGDFRQILPVVERGDREEQVKTCIKKSPLWSKFTQYRLQANMRVQGDAAEWKQYLLNIGDGKEHTDKYGNLPVPEDLQCNDNLIDQFFGAFFDGTLSDALTEVAILTPKNSDALRINNEILHKLPGEAVIFKSIDEAITSSPSDALNFPTEFLNKMTPGGLPPHELHLKVGAIIMLLRNLDVKNGLCNGTRLTIAQIGRRILCCTITTGSRQGEPVLIPRIDCYFEQGIPFKLRRRQFPVRLSFAMTINKAQGQSFNRVGLWLEDSIFSHGQLYVALSRARSKEGIKIKSKDNRMRNIVYHEVL